VDQQPDGSGRKRIVIGEPVDGALDIKHPALDRLLHVVEDQGHSLVG
jgi:hypothetical protein